MKRAALLAIMLLVLFASPAAACFGPKLYLGGAAGPEGDALFELVALYVKEKTGVETVRVDLAGEAPLAALAAERADLVLVAGETPEASTLLRLEGLPRLVAGLRPQQDLQFTTVMPALRKLGRLLSAADVAALTAAVERGESAAAAARRLLMTKGWI